MAYPYSRPYNSRNVSRLDDEKSTKKRSKYKNVSASQEYRIYLSMKSTLIHDHFSTKVSGHIL